VTASGHAYTLYGGIPPTQLNVASSHCVRVVGPVRERLPISWPAAAVHSVRMASAVRSTQLHGWWRCRENMTVVGRQEWTRSQECRLELTRREEWMGKRSRIIGCQHPEYKLVSFTVHAYQKQRPFRVPSLCGVD